MYKSKRRREFPDALCADERSIIIHGIDESLRIIAELFPEEVDAAMKRGRAKANIKVGNALMKAIEGGNVTAIIFYLKARAGWTEKQQIEAEIKSKENVPEGLPALYAKLREQVFSPELN